MTTVIHHNPDCGTSRNVLAVIRASGTEPVIRVMVEGQDDEVINSIADDLCLLVEKADV